MSDEKQDDWLKVMDEVSSKKDVQSVETPQADVIIKVLRGILADSKWTPHERIALAQMILKDGFTGGKISIIKLRKLIGIESNQTSINILNRFERNGIITRIRAQKDSSYTFTKSFVDHLLEEFASSGTLL